MQVDTRLSSPVWRATLKARILAKTLTLSFVQGGRYERRAGFGSPEQALRARRGRPANRCTQPHNRCSGARADSLAAEYEGSGGSGKVSKASRGRYSPTAECERKRHWPTRRADLPLARKVWSARAGHREPHLYGVGYLGPVSIER